MKLFFIIFVSLCCSYSFANFNFTKDRSLLVFKVDALKDSINRSLALQGVLPKEVKTDLHSYKVYYSINEKLNDYVKNLIKNTRSDYAAVVVLDNNSGEILSLTDYDKAQDKFGTSLALNATSPAASVFKVITAADIIENTDVTKTTLFTYNGRGTTLYKNQLRPEKNKWTRTSTLERAFALSNNVVFAKAALSNSEISSIYKTATKFGFNEPLLDLIDVLPSKIFEAQTSYNLAELASGFNRETLISPLHGATIASVIANDGVMKKPSLVLKVEDSHLEKDVWKQNAVRYRVLSPETSHELKSMMHRTVIRGTARGAFKKSQTKKLSDIYIGGKTGSITGGVPFGKRDWFISYAIPNESQDDLGISVGVMVVNIKKWHVKSTYLAKKIIEYYYGDLNL